MAAASDGLVTPTLHQLAPILDVIGLPPALAVTRMPGGSNAVFRVDLANGERVNIKTSDDLRGKAPAREAHAAKLLADADIAATRYLFSDESCTQLPYRFAVTSYLPGQTLEQLKLAGGIGLDNAYREMGALLRQVHGVSLPLYGAIDDGEDTHRHRTNSAFIAAFATAAIERFRAEGGAAELAVRMEVAVSTHLDAADHSLGPVFAHNDFQIGNVLAEVRNGAVVVTGLIDFGNALAADAIFDLAKAIFCTEHMVSGAGALLLEGYGVIDYPEPQRALWLYTLLHRVSMWAWLRHIGVIARGQHDALIDDLEAMLAERGL
ncbi:aminoglycoside phosphotransferase family protein [Devosia sp. Leaf64]|uniref:phosphotransferase family protein n=1 Tax=Devosia sp. Leaf64 TaxID=1736229 RepID=UPI000714F9B9|nr:aminoglycoside phosphotransferase family protein [Devosia sp. Leaf64]KQN77578.1 hypothetical protein ASE94_16395 [Devosia sp. Leaf64]